MTQEEKKAYLIPIEWGRVKAFWKQWFGFELEDWQLRSLAWGAKRRFDIPSIRAQHRHEAEREFGSWDKVILEAARFTKVVILARAEKRYANAHIFSIVHLQVWGPALKKAQERGKANLPSLDERGWKTFWGWMREHKVNYEDASVFKKLMANLAKEMVKSGEIKV